MDRNRMEAERKKERKKERYKRNKRIKESRKLK
jgi:hypothetical protein